MKVTPKLIGDFVGYGPEIDHNGGKIRPEVKVSIASGLVKSMKEKNGMYNVILEIEGAEYEMNGYISVQEPAAQIIKKAYDEKIVIALRFEKKRKKTVAPDVGIIEISKTVEIARQNIVKTTVGVFDFNSETWILSREAQTNPADDDESVFRNLKSAAVDIDGFFDSPVQNPAQPSINTNKEEESKENALMSMYFFVHEQIQEKGLTLDSQKRRELAINLLQVANLIQMRMFNMEKPVYSAYSHTRARFLVFKWAEVMVPLTQEHVNNISPWGKNLIQNGIGLWTWCRDESNKI